MNVDVIEGGGGGGGGLGSEEELEQLADRSLFEVVGFSVVFKYPLSSSSNENWGLSY